MSDSALTGTADQASAKEQWYIGQLLEQFRRDPSSVDQSWRDYFTAHGQGPDATPAGEPPQLRHTAPPAPPAAPAPPSSPAA
ncbi:hypothetical protein ACFQ23_06925, partial [Schaalia naturae]|uniref:2-oxoglutarate dehydrogenase E1 subunit family protein n=1 Tax=Schaalia naturae TaxID=635203 RepID=UPI0036387268